MLDPKDFCVYCDYMVTTSMPVCTKCRRANPRHISPQERLAAKVKLLLIEGHPDGALDLLADVDPAWAVAECKEVG